VLAPRAVISPPPVRIGVFLDSPDETWVSMQLAGEMLLAEWRGALAAEVSPGAFTVRLPRLARRLPGLSAKRAAFNADRVAGRFLVYPPLAALQRRRFDFFHVVDHSYAHLVHALPHARTGVFCHDLDAFRSLLPGAPRPRAAWFRAMQRATLTGMQSAAIVFHTTSFVRDEIERYGLVPGERLVHAPLGISPEYRADAGDDGVARGLLAPLGGRPYLLHVGSAVPRKRLDVLFETFARLRTAFPELRLVQHGAALDEGQRALLAASGIEGAFLQPAPGKSLARETLAALYRGARAVLMPSDREGFGIPVIEGLACGVPVFASDLPVFREVGGDAVVYCRVGDADDWAGTLRAFLAGTRSAPPRAERLARAAKYTWSRHARTVLDAYAALPARA
jgi:glycosyltransferase involved in cell wall biosynthesis